MQPSFVVFAASVAAVSLAATLTACGGGAGNATPSAGSVSTTATASGTATLFVPAKGAASASATRKAKFVSPSATSLGVTVNGGAASYNDVSATSTFCAVVSGGRSCTVPLTVPVGTDTIALTLYDAAAGAGKLLATGSASTTGTSGVTFSVAITLSPVVASVTTPVFTFSSGTAFSVGASASAAVAFTLLDPDNNVITPSAAPSFSAPLQLTSSDPHVAIAPSSWTGAAQTITLTYDGSNAVGNTVTATVKSGSSAIGTAATMPAFHYVVSTFAGSGATGSLDGTGTAATFNGLYGIAVDTAGNVYVADTFNEKIREITPAGAVTTIAGGGGTGSADGAALSATFSTPFGVAADNAGNVYVADHDNNKIRKISGGVVSTFAGTGAAGANNGPGASATFSGPRGISTDASGNVYVSEIEFGGQKIRMITPAGVVSTIAGSGAAGAMNGPALMATFAGPSGVTPDGNGNFYIPDANNNLIREISGGNVTTFAGTGSASPLINGPAATATFNHPDGIGIDSAGDLLVAEPSNNVIRLITPGGIVSTLAGSGVQGAADGVGTAATFNSPIGVAIDRSGNIYVAETGNNKIRKIVP